MVGIASRILDRALLPSKRVHADLARLFLVVPNGKESFVFFEIGHFQIAVTLA